MANDDARARYLATGPDQGSRGDERLDLMRDVLADGATWSEPPQTVLDGVLAAVTDDGSSRSSQEGSARWPLLTAVVGSAVAVVALVVATVTVLDSAVEDTTLALVGTEIEAGAGGTAAVRPTGSGWWIRLDLNGLPPAPDGYYYEGWVWSDDGEGVSIGTFHLRGGEGPIILWSGVEMEEYPSIWVTLEDEDGVAEASDRIVLKGRMPETGGA